jgi:hypothetical protein
MPVDEVALLAHISLFQEARFVTLENGPTVGTALT